MYHSKPEPQPALDFMLPFGGKLDINNRWVQRAGLIPWKDIELIYAEKFQNDSGRVALDARISFGAILLKDFIGATDRDLVEHITENPYLQYFIGLQAFTTEAPFHHTSMVSFRSRWDENAMQRANQAIRQYAIKLSAEQASEDDKDSDDTGCTSTQEEGVENTINDPAGPMPDENKQEGKLIIDATCTPADITFPTDLKVLNNGRENLEAIIDTFHKEDVAQNGSVKKPRTYRNKARRQFLSAARAKRLKKNVGRKAIRNQLEHIKRDLSIIDRYVKRGFLKHLSPRQHKNLLVVHTVYQQQREMYDTKKHSIAHRIVSISQPHVRPIVRGKAHAKTEFGAKISLSVVDGYCFVDRISWDSYNEGADLIRQVETYKERFGNYPESVHADKLYRTRANRAYCKAQGIRLSGSKLGRPEKVTDANRERLAAEKAQAWLDECDRSAVEGKFGQSKRRFGLNRVMAKLSTTSESMIHSCFIAMNIDRLLFCLFSCLLCILEAFLVCYLIRRCAVYADCRNVAQKFPWW